MCNKIKYSTSAIAQADAVYIKKTTGNRRRDTGKKVDKLKPYFCSHCGYFHLTSSKRRKYRGVKHESRADQVERMNDGGE